MWMQGSTYSQPRHWEEVGWLVLHSAAFTPGEIPRYSFYRRLSGPQGQSGHEGVKKNLHPLRHPASNPGRPARSEAPCRLRHLAHLINLYRVRNCYYQHLYGVSVRYLYSFQSEVFVSYFGHHWPLVSFLDCDNIDS